MISKVTVYKTSDGETFDIFEKEKAVEHEAKVQFEREVGTVINGGYYSGMSVNSVIELIIDNIELLINAYNGADVQEDQS